MNNSPKCFNEHHAITILLQFNGSLETIRKLNYCKHFLMEIA